jgi:hypothetical protein
MRYAAETLQIHGLIALPELGQLGYQLIPSPVAIPLDLFQWDTHILAF